MAPEKDLILMRGRIIGLAEGGMKLNDIARQLGLGKSVVYKRIKRWKDERSIGSDKRSGRPRKTTEEEDKIIVQMAESNPFIPSTSIQQNLNIDLSKSTIGKRLKEAGFRSRIPVEKEMLTQTHKEK